MLHMIIFEDSTENVVWPNMILNLIAVFSLLFFFFFYIKQKIEGSKSSEAIILWGIDQLLFSYCITGN